MESLSIYLELIKLRFLFHPLETVLVGWPEILLIMINKIHPLKGKKKQNHIHIKIIKK